MAIEPLQFKKMTTVALINAINKIQEAHPYDEIVSIEFEDGSGKCFNYQLLNSNSPSFIRING